MRERESNALAQLLEARIGCCLKVRQFLKTRVDCAGQFLDGKRLCNVIVSTGFHPLSDFGLFAEATQKDKRNRCSVFVVPNRVENSITIHLWHLDVAKNQIRQLAFGHLQTGQVFVPRSNALKVRLAREQETDKSPSPLSSPENDPLSYLAAVVRGELKPSGLSSLENNMIVTEILDAARESAKTGKRIDLQHRH